MAKHHTMSNLVCEAPREEGLRNETIQKKIEQNKRDLWFEENFSKFYRIQ